MNTIEQAIDRFDNAAYNERENRGKSGYSYHMEEYYEARSVLLKLATESRKQMELLREATDLLIKTKTNLGESKLTCELLVPGSERFQSLLEKRMTQIDQLVTQIKTETNYE